MAPFGSSFLYPWSIWLIFHQVSERHHHFHLPPSESWSNLMYYHWPLRLFTILHIEFRIKDDVCLVNESKSCIHDWSAYFLFYLTPVFHFIVLTHHVGVYQENPDLWNWLTGQAEVPPELATNTVSIWCMLLYHALFGSLIREVDKLSSKAQTTESLIYL